MVAPAFLASSTVATVFSSIPVDSITGFTASWSLPPFVVKSFWNSIRTTAVFFGFIGLMGLVERLPSPEDVNSNAAKRRSRRGGTSEIVLVLVLVLDWTA